MSDTKSSDEAVCQICNRRHMTERDRERGRLAGNITSYNVAKAEEAYRHYMHRHELSKTPPEYAI